MKLYTAIEICRFGPGTRLGMTAEQAKTRMHNLRAVDKDIYETTAHVEFKRGETFGYDGPVSRAQEAIMQPGDEPLPPAPPKPVVPKASTKHAR